MTKFDYYANHDQRRTFKWLGIALGAIFSAVTVGAVLLGVYVARDAQAHPAIKAPPVEAAAVPAPAAPVVTPLPVAPAAVQPAATAATPARRAPSHKVAKATRHAKPTKSPTKDRAAAILAKHDSRSNRKAKDDIDRMLGL